MVSSVLMTAIINCTSKLCPTSFAKVPTFKNENKKARIYKKNASKNAKPGKHLEKKMQMRKMQRRIWTNGEEKKTPEKSSCYLQKTPPKLERNI